jgi:hypothetical protein
MRNSEKFFVTVGAVIFLAASGTSPVQALDGFWHGAVNNQWHQGPFKGSSNWFDAAPPGGSPQEVPDGLAVFPPGADRTTVIVHGKRSIGAIRFSPGTDKYTMRLDPKAQLRVEGDGLTNEASIIHQIRADGKKTALKFLNSAIACKDSTTQLLLTTQKKGTIFFDGESTGTDKCVLAANKKGLIHFFAKSSAGEMNIGLEGKGSKLTFTRQSTADNSSIVNSKGEVRINSKGPAKDFRITAGTIVNLGTLNLGKTSVDMSGELVLQAGSKMNTRIVRDKISAIASKKAMQISGRLLVFGSSNTTPGTYKLLASDKRIDGKFSKVVFKKFGNKTVDIEYARKEVRIIVSQ